MAIKKVYLGPFGPFEYDDSETIDDPDGDFAGESKNAIVTNGDIVYTPTVTKTPTIRHLTVSSSGDVSKTDIGYAPSMLIVLCVDSTNTNINWSVGFDNGTVRGIIYAYMGSTLLEHDDSFSGGIERDGSNYLSFYATILTNGFKLTTTLVGTCSAEVIVCCLP